jgi:putative flavoprotein involved in K+ transport
MAAAASLRKRGIDPLLLEREEELAMSWARRYDSLRLNTPRLTSSLAGYRMPRRYGRWPKRDDVAEYLREYAKRLGLRLRSGSEVTRIDREDGGWLVHAAEGTWQTRCVVVATGHDHHPALPEWPGREDFSGWLLHSSEYREPSPFRGRDVLVVSARNSGTEIALELARRGAARVRSSMRTPPNVFPREWLRWPLNYSAVGLEPFGDRVGDVAGALTQRMIYGDLSRWGIGDPSGGRSDDDPPTPPISARRRRLHRGIEARGG